MTHVCGCDTGCRACATSGARVACSSLAPVPGGISDFLGAAQVAGDLLFGAVESAGVVVDLLPKAACSALKAIGVNGQPLGAWWSSAVVQKVAWWAGWLPPPIMPFPQIAVFAADALATCSISSAFQRGVCRQVAVFDIIAAIGRNAWISALARETVGDAAAEALRAAGLACGSGAVAIGPLCSGKAPSPAELVRFSTELSQALFLMEEAGGPAAFSWLRPIILATIGEEAIAQVEAGQSPDAILAAAIADAGLDAPQVYGTRRPTGSSYQAPPGFGRINTGAFGASQTQPQPSAGGGGALGLAAIAALLLS